MALSSLVLQLWVKLEREGEEGATPCPLQQVLEGVVGADSRLCSLYVPAMWLRCDSRRLSGMITEAR